jgi:hypothetical protein
LRNQTEQDESHWNISIWGPLEEIGYSIQGSPTLGPPRRYFLFCPSRFWRLVQARRSLPVVALEVSPLVAKSLREAVLSLAA